MTGKINWKPSDKDLREFGLTLWVGFGLIGAITLYRGHSAAAHGMWAMAGAVGLLAILVPSWSKPFYWFWMGLGFVLGQISSRLVMALIYFGVLTPLAILFRMQKRDALGLERPKTDSYFKDHPEIAKENYSRLF